jgi:hypothetical protein
VTIRHGMAHGSNSVKKGVAFSWVAHTGRRGGDGGGGRRRWRRTASILRLASSAISSDGGALGVRRREVRMAAGGGCTGSWPVRWTRSTRVELDAGSIGPPGENWWLGLNLSLLFRIRTMLKPFISSHLLRACDLTYLSNIFLQIWENRIMPVRCYGQRQHLYRKTLN